MELRRRANEFTSGKTISVYVGTLNLNGKLTGLRTDLSPWLLPSTIGAQRPPEIVAVAFQEIVELNPQQLMKEDPQARLQWEKAVLRTLNEHASEVGGPEYVLLRSGQLVGAALLIFVQKGKLKRVKNVEGAIKKTGLSGMAGNKGAVAIRMEYANTSLCFVTAHLAAGFSNYEDRNRDYRTISQGLRFQRNRTIDDHESVFWFGDFNYRIGLGNDKVRMLIDHGDLDTLLENDQLYIQRTRSSVSNVFDHYDEAKITFLPTYKFDLGTDTYDTSEKGRIPAWTDRVLKKGNNIRQISYNSAPLRFSDHRPVYATFEVDVSIVDEKYREELGLSLYKQRKKALKNGTADDIVQDPEEDDLLGFEPVQSGWPAASSDRQKWWLANGT
jgi:endonuclease/exonuclease/phosphatase family metal-dependent hydrolase